MLRHSPLQTGSSCFSRCYPAANKMAVFGGFFKAIVFVSFILSIVPSVFPAECDTLLLALNGADHNQTEFLLPPRPREKQRKIRCQCSDLTQTVKWFFNNGTEVPPQVKKSQVQLQVYSRARMRAKEEQDSLLVISKEASPFEYVGGYRCESDGSNASINIVVKDPSIEVTVFPVTTEVTVKDGTEALMLLCNITIVSGGTVEWTKDGTSISYSARHTVETRDSSSRLQIKNLTKSDAGAYQCVYNMSGAIFYSNQSAVSITGFIQVSIEPSDSVVVEITTEGQLNCVANGYQAEMFMYQWRLNGTDISDATDKTLVISSTTESDRGRYECTVTNHWGEMITSDSTELIVTRNLPVITTNPEDVTVTLHHGNESAAFSCEANGGSSDIQYSWFTKTNDGDMMPEGETSNELVLNMVIVEMNNTQYYCVASNNSGNVTSESAHLTITTFIQANIQPIDDTVEVGTMVTFECVAEGYRPETFKYQWRHDNNDLPDSNNKTLILSSVTEDHSGSYECIVTNNWNVTTTSLPAMLTVTRNNPPIITTNPEDVTVTLRHGNESATFSCGGSSDIHYIWFAKTNDGDMMLEGETSNELVLNMVTVEMNNTQYYCVASNDSGNVTSESAHLTVTTFIQANIQLSGDTVEVGTMVTFKCVAEGYQPETFKYQWIHDNNDLPDSNNKTLILTSVTEDHSGSYECVVTNNWNVMTISPPAMLTVTRNPPVITTQPMNATVSLRYSNESAVFSCEANEGNSDIQYIWFTKTSDGDMMLEGKISNELVLNMVTVEMNNTQYYCVASNNSGNVTSQTGHLTVDFAIGPPMIVAHPPEVMHFVVSSSSDTLTLSCTAVGEGVVNWQKDGLNIDDSKMPITPGGNTLDIAPDDITDTSVGVYRCIASNVAGSVMSNSTSVTVSGDIQVTIEQSDLSAEVTTTVQFTCKADGYQSSVFSYQWRLNQDDIDGANDKTYVIPSVNETDRGKYECVVTNHWNGEDTSDPVQLNVTRNLPVIVMGPQNFTVLITNDDPGRVEFSCMTEERADHKWYTIVQGKEMAHKNPSNKTSSTYRININLSHNGTQVYCEATNGSGTVQSQIATVTILVPPPLITEHPEVLVNATVGDSVAFQCTAESFGHERALRYYWREILDNNTAIPINGATTSLLEFTTVAEDDSTFYQCATTNENGTAFSNVGRLNLLPSIIVQPENIYVQHNVSVTLYCEAVGGNNINYQWTKNGTIVQGYSNHGNLTIESVQRPDEGVYQCEAMNERGEVALSEQAEIVIYDKFLLDINVTDTEHYVLQGSDAYISCAVNIQPSPSGGINITWYRGNDDLSSISELVEINGTSYLILHLQNIEKEDKGMYVCSVDDGNVEGGINISTNVIVEYPPTITDFPEVGPFKVGEPIHVFCSASGVPSPTVTLFINGEQTFEGPLIVVHNITSATTKNDHGTYKCVARSISRATEQPFPAASKSIQIVVQGVPEKIKRGKLQYNPINLTAIRLTWAEPLDSNSPIINYTVSCDKCPTKSITVDTNVTVITGLIPGVEYKLNVAAVNAFGRGPDSVAVTAQSATSDSTTVTNLDVVAFGEVLVALTWMDPQLYAPMIKEYTIHAVSNDHDKMITVPAGEQSPVITDLVPTFSYNVSVVVTYNVASFMSDPTVLSVTLPECEACVEPQIVQPTSKNLTDLSFTLKWSPIDTGLLQSYTLFYTSVMISQLPVAKRQIENQINISVHSTNYTVENLMPFSSYCFSLQASYAQEAVVFSHRQSDAICDINTPPLASSAPVNLKVEDVDFTSVTISWSPPSDRHGIIIKYEVYYSSEGVNRSQLTENTDDLQYKITSLTPGTPYSISVAAITYHPYGDDLEGPWSDTIDVSTSFAAPVVVSQPSTAGSPDLEQLTTVITVPTIDESLGEMSHYLVVVVIGELPSGFATPDDIPDNQLLPYDEATEMEYNYYVATGGQLANTSHILGNEDRRVVGSMEYYNARLTPDQQYSYFVRVYSKHNSTTYSTSELSPHFVIASDDKEASSPLGVIVGAVAIVLVIIIILLIVLILLLIRIHSTKNTNKEAPLRDLPSPNKEHKPVSTAAPGFERKPSVPFIGTQSVDICTSVGPPTTLSIEVGGKPLPEVQWFKDDNPVVHRMLADNSLYIESTSISDDGKYTARVTNAAGKSEESIHVTVLEPSPPQDDPGHPPIRVEDFAQHVAYNRSNMEELFIEEYRDLEVEQTFSQHNARIPNNRNKNRYINITPYDHSRVTLETDYQVAGSDYINASYIDGYSRSGEYIATQGPLASTFGDFWKMIWEKRSTTIVMLTNLNEDDRIKCHQYWPSYGSVMYDNFRVTLKSVETLAEYSIRVFIVEQINNGNDALEVHQFHYTVWPDHGVPDCGTPLLSFHSRVEKFFKCGTAPMVVHCSAGVGRTGTFIVIDTQMQRIKDQSTIDIFNNVRRLRFCRNYMVQTQSQYSFLHDVMLEAIMCGDTSLGAPVQNIMDRLRDLAAVDQDTKETLFIKQFKMLDSDVLQEKKFTYTVATAQKNAAKNRYQNHLAADQNFVCLPTTDDRPGYVNASFVDGYRMRNAFIVTQGPLENTIEDFWEMIWEYKSHAIVMLTPLKENEKEQCCQYWPDVGTKEYGSFVVEATKFYEPIGGEFKREFKLSHVSKPMETRVVTQFHYVNWPEDSCPDNGACMIDLIDSVERVQRKTGNGPITVHCNDGIGRSGTFCALVSSLERFKAEQMADIFQTIKKMRMQRARIVQTPEQYEFLHKALLEAIERFDTYSNFT